MVAPPAFFKAIGKAGFTLIEMSIVLVIIGLIIGGVLVGRDLIAAATIRSQISQIEKYQTAVNTFRGKYGYLPGDIPPSIAGQYGFFTLTGANAGTIGYGDGDGSIAYYCNGNEALVLWRHLSDSNLIEGAYGSAIDSTTGMTTVSLLQSLPQAKIGGVNYLMVTNQIPFAGVGTVHVNSFDIIGVTAASCGASFSITPLTAYAIDSKMDDGMPNTGRVFGLGNYGPYPGQCLNGGTAPNYFDSTYNIVSGGNTPGCYMAFEFE